MQIIRLDDFIRGENLFFFLIFCVYSYYWNIVLTFVNVDCCRLKKRFEENSII